MDRVVLLFHVIRYCKSSLLRFPMNEGGVHSMYTPAKYTMSLALAIPNILGSLGGFVKPTHQKQKLSVDAVLLQNVYITTYHVGVLL